MFPEFGHSQYVKLHLVRLNVARHSDVEVGFLGKARGMFTLNLWVYQSDESDINM